MNFFVPQAIACLASAICIVFASFLLAVVQVSVETRSHVRPVSLVWGIRPKTYSMLSTFSASSQDSSPPLAMVRCRVPFLSFFAILVGPIAPAPTGVLPRYGCGDTLGSGARGRTV